MLDDDHMYVCMYRWIGVSPTTPVGMFWVAVLVVVPCIFTFVGVVVVGCLGLCYFTFEVLHRRLVHGGGFRCD